MLRVMVLFAVACFVGIFLGRMVPWGRGIGRITVAALVCVVSLIVWWYGLFFQVVRFDELLARFNIHRLEGALGLLIFFGPPVALAAVVLIALQARASRRTGGYSRR
jgi:hypothetical protein